MSIFLGAMLLLIVGHFIRLLRWKKFIEVYETPCKKDLIRSLVLGYTVNFCIPFRVGDLFRAIYSGKRMKNGVSFSLATIIVERYLDVIVVGFIFILINLTGGNSEMVTRSTLFYSGFGILLVVLSVIALRFTKYPKIIIKKVCAIFNFRIELKLLNFSWTIITAFKDLYIKLDRKDFILKTLSMWICYLSSYYLFAAFAAKIVKQYALVDIFTLLFSHNSLDVATVQMAQWTSDILHNFPMMFSIYMIVPLICLAGFSFLPVKYLDGAIKDTTNELDFLKLLPHVDTKERLDFLEAYFSGNNREYFANYLEINRNISIIRDFSAGSNATTLLCQDDEKTFFRKYAIGDESAKLKLQIDWMREHEDSLTLAEITNEKHDKGYCYYDMSYNSASLSLFDFVHTMPFDISWELIHSVLLECNLNLHSKNVVACSEKLLNDYIETKVINNLKIFQKTKTIKSLLDYETLVINGKKYKNLVYFEEMLSKESLYEVFKKDEYSDMHGDLTIENIISLRSYDETGYYIIDPNPGNLHNSPNLDYAKLLQSLHGSYEFLMRTNSFEVHKNHINFLFTRSHAYDVLLNRYKNFLFENFEQYKVKSIYYHEIVHWLRLMPYKINKDSEWAVIFFAGLIIILNDIEALFNKDFEAECSNQEACK